MAILSPDQLTVLREQKIPLSGVFDASGMGKLEYGPAMKSEGKSFAYGVTPCGAGGHTLRTRSGHCIQCNHANIAFILRREARAFVYIAVSWNGRFIKIGSSIDVADRAKKLVEHCYGGQTDWQIVSTARSEAAGRVESETQTKLSSYSVPGEYTRAGKIQRCYELFRCNFEDARDALKSSLSRGEAITTVNEARALHRFNFR
jgi:hypothetical protein